MVDPRALSLCEQTRPDAGPELTLVQELEAQAAASCLSGRALASLIGIDHGAWSRVRRGQERFGVEACTRIVQEFPHLRLVVARYLTERYDQPALTLLEEASRLSRTTDQRP